MEEREGRNRREEREERDKRERGRRGVFAQRGGTFTLMGAENVHESSAICVVANCKHSVHTNWKFQVFFPPTETPS